MESNSLIKRAVVLLGNDFVRVSPIKGKMKDSTSVITCIIGTKYDIVNTTVVKNSSEG